MAESGDRNRVSPMDRGARALLACATILLASCGSTQSQLPGGDTHVGDKEAPSIEFAPGGPAAPADRVDDTVFLERPPIVPEFPNLSRVPPRPEGLKTAEERSALVEELEAARDPEFELPPEAADAPSRTVLPAAEAPAPSVAATPVSAAPAAAVRFNDGAFDIPRDVRRRLLEFVLDRRGDHGPIRIVGVASEEEAVDGLSEMAPAALAGRRATAVMNTLISFGVSQSLVSMTTAIENGTGVGARRVDIYAR